MLTGHRSACTLTLLCAAVTLPAQGLALTVAALPGRTEMRIERAPRGVGVAVVIGLRAGSGVFQGYQFGIDEPALFGAAFAGTNGTAHLAATFPIESRRGLEFVAEAIAFDPQLPLGSAGVLARSPVVKATVPPMQATADVVVLFGQSNAEGHADDGALPANLRGALPRCRIWVEAVQAFAAMEHGVNTRSYGPPDWCGPELALGHALTGSGDVVYLLKVAAPGTTLGPTVGPWNEWGAHAGELYAVLMFRLTSACARLRADGLVPRVRAVCMMQGESDAMTGPLARAYGENLTALVAKLRSDLRAAHLVAADEPAPFVVGRIHGALPRPSFPGLDLVREAQRVAMRASERAACVDTDALTHGPDGVHLDAAGVCELGRRFAAAVVALR